MTHACSAPAVLIMPSSSRTRARTSGRITRRDVLRGFAAAGIGMTTGTAAHGFLYERHRLEVTRATVAMIGLPEALAGLRVGFLTDLHRSSTVPHELIQSAVRLLMEERTDLIILGGDYVTWGDRRFVLPAADALAPLVAPHGVFGVLGNHDDDRDMPAALSERGIEVLRDARTRIAVRGERLDIIGIRYWTRNIADIAALARGAAPATILVAHTPWRLIQAAALGLPLMLSGHTHGGQVVLPGIGAVAARNFPIVAGYGQRENTTAFVSRGVGTVYVPIRVGCPPEVAVLTLKSPEVA
jgi:predicted MPP superfamily phosphohydrolase